MTSAIADSLPLGLGIAFNPVAVVVCLLILREPRSRRQSPAFVLGWVLGLALLETISSVLAHNQFAARRLPETLLAVIWIGPGLLLILLAAFALRRRPPPGEPAVPQRWLHLINTGGSRRVFAVGLFLSTASLRNLALLAAAASILGQAQLAPPERVVTIVAFVMICSAGILIPFLVLAIGGADADTILDQWATWLGRHMQTITGLLSGVLGLYLLAKGIAVIV